MKQKAFTLIELLIVVAIIGILAAIAVPNFLNAQVRAKVSRAMSDMRSQATAQGMYKIDNGIYTPSASRETQAVLPRRCWRLRGLTTPVAYLSTLPPDIFPVTTAQADDQLTVDQLDNSCYIYSDKDSYIATKYAGNPGVLSGKYFALYYQSHNFFFASWGPNAQGTFNNIPFSLFAETSDPSIGPMAYNPSNGIMSAGYLWNVN